jgi:hypothetical protein
MVLSATDRRPIGTLVRRTHRSRGGVAAATGTGGPAPWNGGAVARRRCRAEVADTGVNATAFHGARWPVVVEIPKSPSRDDDA